MKRILITGENSYIGTSFEKWMKQWPESYIVDTVDMVDDRWREKDFSQYDVVFHVAGIAHSDIGKSTDKMKEFYYKINTVLTIETAKKARDEGVKQFVFMSSAIVYGASTRLGDDQMITKDTKPKPANFYGDSKLQAESGIKLLENDVFKIVILRPPMIFGKSCAGNYPILSKYSIKLPVFPDINNKRSMLYIGNLCAFIKIIIENEEAGIFWPQNKEFVKTSDLVHMISGVHNKKIRLVKIFNPFIYMASKLPGKVGDIVNKTFGNFYYDKELSKYPQEYCQYSLKESIDLTENG